MPHGDKNLGSGNLTGQDGRPTGIRVNASSQVWARARARARARSYMMGDPRY